jgi:hypothetical protein
MALSDFLTLTAKLAQDNRKRLASGDLAAAVAEAVARYSADRPRRTVEDVTLEEAGHFVALPEEWEEAFSELQQVEYPIGRVPPALLPRGEDWDLYPSPAGPVLMSLAELPAEAELRLTFTRKHVLSDAEDTIPRHHREAVCCWAAALLCDELAAANAANAAPTIAADKVDQTSPQKAYAALARTLRQRYRDEIGVEEKRNAAAGVVVSHRDLNSLGGTRLTHPLRDWRGRR